MRNREQYQDFLKCLSLFSEDIISKHELLNLIVDSLSRHPDLQVQPLAQDDSAPDLLEITLPVMLTHAVDKTIKHCESCNLLACWFLLDVHKSVCELTLPRRAC